MGTANFAFVQGNTASTATFSNLEVNDVKATNFMGFKLGAQYKVGQATLLGLTYRSETELKGDGSYGGRSVAPGPFGGPFSGSNNVMTVFPSQITLGARHDYEKWVSLLEYSWTQYSRVGEINVNGPLLLNGTATGQNNVQLKTVWRDQHAVRVGGEYLGLGMPIRAGYIWTSAVTNEDYARASFPPPGSGHTITLGSGQTFSIMEKPLQVDVAGEYTMISGDGKGSAAGASGNGLDTGREGKYSANAYALHLGVTYAF
jgi:long-subunit fatty acid transport protein